jgi:hypothetical protein
MNKINREELKAVIIDYVNSSIITEPLFISFGKHEEPIALKIMKEVFGDSNSFKIGATYDNPRADIPYCIYDTYFGDDNSFAILIHCVEIAKSIHRPVFCFISHDKMKQLPEGAVSSSMIYDYSEE